MFIAFATKHGAGIVMLLDKTGFKSYREFMTETTPYERRFLSKALQEYQSEVGGQLGGL